MIINNSWNFVELIDNLKMLKQQYDEFLAFFLLCDLDTRIVNIFIKNIKDKFYALNLKEWQIDVCWEYMNGDKLYGEIVRIIRKIDNK